MRPVLLDLWVDIMRTDITDVRMYISHCPSIDCSKVSIGRVIMDYKKEIIEMIEKINDDSLLEFFYRFIARVLKNRGN